MVDASVILGLRMELARVGAALKKGGKTEGLKRLADLDAKLADRERKINNVRARIKVIGKG